MPTNRIFVQTRRRLAGLYTGSMGLILGLCGVGFYQAMVVSHWYELDQKLQSVAGILHDGVESSLQTPQTLTPEITQFLPNLCVQLTQPDGSAAPCSFDSAQTERRLLGLARQEGYYVRFLSPTGTPLASTTPLTFEHTIDAQPWQGGAILDTTLADSGERYRRVLLPLHTQQDEAWGFLEVGRSLGELERHVVAVQLVLAIGLPVALIGVGATSWWLAGRAMTPVVGAYQNMQQFSADAAHELRTPLAAIQATVEAVLGQAQPSAAELRSTLSVIERQNQRLSKLVQDLLLLIRLDGAQAKATYQPCCLNELGEDLVEEYAHLALAASVTLTLAPRPGKKLMVLGNLDQLYRLVGNLVVNGIQHTPPQGQVTLKLSQDGSHGLIQVIDTGSGIPQADQPHIFNRFYRADSARSRQTGGVGLGLAIAQAIAQAHGGKISLDSQIQPGSCFTLRLPLCSAAEL